MEFNAPLMRAAMESAQLFKKSHVMFVPMPALDQQDLMGLLRESGERLEKLEAKNSEWDPIHDEDGGEICGL